MSARMVRTAESWRVGLHADALRAEESFSGRVVRGHVTPQEPFVVFDGTEIPDCVYIAAGELVERRSRNIERGIQ